MLKREPRIFVCGYCHLAASLVSFLFRLVVYSIRLMLGPELEVMAKILFFCHTLTYMLSQKIMYIIFRFRNTRKLPDIPILRFASTRAATRSLGGSGRRMEDFHRKREEDLVDRNFRSQERHSLSGNGTLRER